MFSVANIINASQLAYARQIWLYRRLMQQRKQVKRRQQQKQQQFKPRPKPKRQTKSIAFSAEKYETRTNYYLGEYFKQNPPLNMNQDPKSQTFMKLSKSKNKVGHWLNYAGALLKLLKNTNKTSQSFKLHVGDNASHKPPGTLVKTRNNKDTGSVILRCFNFNRHWKNYYNRPSDIPFDKKISALIWRGTTTGKETGANRFNLVKTWFNKHPKINVGFSSICQMKDTYNKYVKSQIPMHGLLKYKYILSVEGNDKDTGINWKLNSNSLVFMAKPSVSSWLMESTLKPNCHYILLKDDFSDLLEKIKWCDNNPNKCKEIIKNANRFMSQFKNPAVEANIEKTVIKKYFELTGQ